MIKPSIGIIGLKGLPAFGGAAAVGEGIIKELKNDFSFTVYAVATHAGIINVEDGFKQIVFKEFFIRKLNIFFYYLRSALHCIFSERYDLIHLHHTDGAFIIPLLKIKYKVICTSHSQPQINEKWSPLVKLFFRINEKLTIWLADIITVVSLPLKETYESKSNRKFYYIPNGVSMKQKISQDTISPDRYILFAAGRIIPLKGLHILLQALNLGNFRCKLMIIGDINQIPSYKVKILKLCKDLDVEFMPVIKEKDKLLNYIQQSNLFIFPSYNENMSMMLLEAVYAKAPIICSDIPANTAVFNEEEVLFFKTNDVQDLMNKIRFALDQPEVMALKAEAAYKKLKLQYNWGKIAGNYAQLYYDLLRIPSRNNQLKN